MREAYPVTTTAKRGLPKFYAYHSTSGNKIKFMFSPIPDANYTLEHIYAKYPTSIVTAGGTYLGDNFDSALLNTLSGAICFSATIRWMGGGGRLECRWRWIRICRQVHKRRVKKNS